MRTSSFRYGLPIRLLAVVLLLTGCAPVTAESPAVLQSKLERVSNPQLDPQDQASLADSNTAFALDLAQRLRSPDGNLFYSPYSISEALAMVYAGAQGQTEQAMRQVLHFSLPQDRLHPAFNSLDQALAQRAAPPQNSESGFQLSVANSIWGQSGFPFLPAYLDRLALNYGAGLRTTDFSHAPEPARQAINQWVSQQTHDKIKDIIPPGVIQSSTRLVLANAIYFKAAWLYPFEKSVTQNQLFTLLDKHQVQVPMMVAASHELRYLAGNGYQAVEVPYVGGDVAMLVLLPDADQFQDFEAGLDAAQLAQIMSSAKSQPVILSMPKFTLESTLGLSDYLKTMGMSAAFDPAQADFSGMDGQRDLFISAVLHKAYVVVDEAGTEAAAATAVVMGLTAALVDEPIKVTIDRPFIFLIYHRSTQTILFFGRMLNPME
jgi:serpin B